jgi:glycosyltransferase involved in cell wall biosynthesis
VFALNVVDRAYLLRADSPAAAGLYSVSVKLAMAVIVAVRGFQLAWPPLVYSVADDHEARRLYALVTTGYVLLAGYVVAAFVLHPAFDHGLDTGPLRCGTPCRRTVHGARDGRLRIGPGLRRDQIVIATEGGAVSEVVGRAGLFFDPRDPDDIAGAIAKIAGDPALLVHLKMECLPRAAELSWSHSASAMIDLLEAHARQRP